MSTALYTANEFVLLSLPLNAKPAGTGSTAGVDTDTWLRTVLIGGKVHVSPFEVPEFKIGSLDSLIIDAEELSKIDTQIGGSISKILEILGSFNEANTTSYKTVSINNVPVPEYLTHFQWSYKKFKLDKSIKELVEVIGNESTQLDNDVRATFTNYNSAKTNLLAAERKKTGDLSVRSLHDIVKPENFILDSEHLTTVLVAVPKSLKSVFEKKYESLADNVVPCSAGIISQDAEFILYNVHLFKKNVNQFISAAREMKFIPRDFVYSEELVDQLKKEHDSAASLEHSLKVQLIKLAKTAYSDIFMNWFHIKALRVYVESVLRYGLPPHFNIKIIAVPPKFLKTCKDELVDAFGFLSGNAFIKDKSGKILKNDQSLNQFASVVDTEYEPFVNYIITL